MTAGSPSYRIEGAPSTEKGKFRLVLYRDSTQIAEEARPRAVANSGLYVLIAAWGNAHGFRGATINELHEQAVAARRAAQEETRALRRTPSEVAR